MTRGNRSAALMCLAVALFAQLLLPAMHAAVHAREHHGARHHHGGGGHDERAWVITKAGGKPVAAKAHPSGEHRHGGAAHRHDATPGASGATTSASADATLAVDASHDPAQPAHHHDGDQPGDRHGAHALEHLTAFYLEATPPALAVPYRLVAPAAVSLVAGRLVTASIDRAQPVRGPPRQS